MVSREDFYRGGFILSHEVMPLGVNFAIFLNSKRWFDKNPNV